MRILAIDPGACESGWVIYDAFSHSVSAFGVTENAGMRGVIERALCLSTVLAIEMIACYGMAVGRDTFETCVWIGQFIREWSGQTRVDTTLEDVAVYRRDVKLFLCNSTRAKDANVRQAILDRFERSGGGKTPQVGIKAQPGPLYGVKSHCWSALGVALTFAARQEN